MKLIGKHQYIRANFVYDENFPALSCLESKGQCEAELVALLLAQKDHCITLDRIMGAYETKYCRKLNFYGYPKLLKLLNSFTNSLQVSS